MDYGLNIPTRGPLATTETITAMATRAEVLGYAHLAVPDHLIVLGGGPIGLVKSLSLTFTGGTGVVP